MNKNLYISNGVKALGWALTAATWFLLLVTLVAVFVPFSPEMPAGNLDPSWQFGVNQAVAQGLSFGRDINFTFGPYASIYTKLYHPATDFMMTSGSWYLALSYWCLLALVFGKNQRRWILILCGFFASLLVLRDPLLFSFPLLAGMAVYQFVNKEDPARAENRWAPLYAALLFAPLGLLPLIKGSLLVLSAATVILCFVFLFASKQRLVAIVCLASPLISMLVLWMLAGQAPTALLEYLGGMAPIISGYTEALSIDGKSGQVVAYLVASICALLAIYISLEKSTLKARVFLTLIFSLFLFVAFKAGFVRHDGHAIIAGTSVLLAALLLPAVLINRFTFPVIAAATFSWGQIDSEYVKTSTERVGHNITVTYSAAWEGVKSRRADNTQLLQRFDAALASLRSQSPFPVMKGSSDIYSFDQSFLIASNNTWSPRPTFQSYSAYTPALAEANKRHLLGGGAPDNIVFKVQPIDGRFPSIDDGASWPALLTGYKPVRMENDFLFLEKRAGDGELAQPLKLVSGVHAFGDKIELPLSGQPIFAQIDIRPSMIGRLVGILYKPTQLQIEIEMSSGEKKQYRIISGMAKSGFVMSPLIENAAEFSELYGDKPYLDSKRVKSIAISALDGNSRDWNTEYSITFSQIPTTTASDIVFLAKRNYFDTTLSAIDPVIPETCNGAIDAVDQSGATPSNLSASSLLKVEGWLIGSIKEGLLADAVYVVMTDSKGIRNYLNTQMALRPDVGSYLKNAKMNESGFTTMGDISGLQGNYTVGLAMKTGGTLKLCPEFKIPVTITR